MGFSNPKRTEAANSNDFKTWDGKKKEAVWPAVDRRVCVCDSRYAVQPSVACWKGRSVLPDCLIFLRVCGNLDLHVKIYSFLATNLKSSLELFCGCQFVCSGNASVFWSAVLFSVHVESYSLLRTWSLPS